MLGISSKPQTDSPIHVWIFFNTGKNDLHFLAHGITESASFCQTDGSPQSQTEASIT
ncbi:MAG: hypothetical protein PUP93_22610 [Rhizonema sp. NSF051]|nr:hypothetical protein [Rhizonema sp. NSF051]